MTTSHPARAPSASRRALLVLVHAAAVAAVVLLTCAACSAAGASAAVPAGMVRVPGGTVRIGSDDGSADERPTFVASVRPFLLDRHPVTVADFRRFVATTGYVTDAERLGDGGVMDHDTGEWRLVPGASWHHPRGPGAPAASDDHPVTQVSWNDAAAYARWRGRRLPTEIEWEHAARGGVDSRARYAWGEALVVAGRRMANTGERAAPPGAGAMDRAGRVAHQHPSADDGWLTTSPVGAFGETALGLTDMGGNVWEWTASWYRPYAARDLPFTPSAGDERVQRGGSFLCSTDYCHGFRVSARAHATPESSLYHVGFRTAADIE